MISVKAVLNVLKQLNNIISKKQKKKSIGVIFTMVICSFLELLGVSILIPFLSLMTNEDELKTKWYMSWFFKAFPDMSKAEMTITMCLAFIIIYILKNAFMIYSAYVQASYAALFNKENASRMLESYLKRPYEYFANTNSSIMIRGINTDVAGVYAVLLDLFVIISEFFTIASIGIFLICMDWLIAVCSLTLAVICMLIIVFVFKNKMKRAGRINQEAASRRGKTSYQAITGIKEITVLDRRDLFVEVFNESIEIERKAAVTRNFLAGCPDRLIEAICLSGFMVVVCLRVISTNDFASFVPILGTFAMGAFKILPSFSKISTRINDMVFYIPCIQNCYENFNEADKYDSRESELLSLTRNKELEQDVSFTTAVDIKDVTWRYINSEKNVLDNVSLEICKGDSVAFIGPSGAGKSTLADIIMGLYVPQSGSVEVDGISIYDIPHSWSKIIGYVPQSVFLIDDTIRKNIAFGLPDAVIDDEKIWNALDQAQLREYVEILPNGLDTIVGERGIKFSGGQRQRIAIARALYENPDILVLDEATSALDNDTESAVMEAIDSLQGQKTLIIIAHRLSTIKNCDKVYMISDGKVELQDKKEL